MAFVKKKLPAQASSKEVGDQNLLDSPVLVLDPSLAFSWSFLFFLGSSLFLFLLRGLLGQGLERSLGDLDLFRSLRGVRDLVRDLERDLERERPRLLSGVNKTFN